MRWFWGMFALVVLAGALLLLRSGRNAERALPPTTPVTLAADPSPSVPPTNARQEPQAAAPATPSAHAIPDIEATKNEVPATKAEPVSTPIPAAGTTLNQPVAAAPGTAAGSPPPPAAPPSTPSPGAAAAPEEAKPAGGQEKLDNALDAALGIPSDTIADDSKPVDAPAPAATTPAETPKPAGSAKEAGGASAKAKLVEQPDGSVLVDDKYIIKGKGTEAEPFTVSWELLVSTQDTYQPRLGRKEIPDRVKMLNGKWVKVSGYTAFPIMAQSHDEMLVMLNQWDGCCIGVPPTPYDAIEVKLKKASSGDDRLKVSGSVKGVFRADPYLIKDWLVSLYLMDDAELIKDEKAPTRQPGMHKGGLATPPGENDEPIK